MNRDLQLSTSRIGDVLGEKHEIFGVRIVRRIGSRQVPFRLGRCRSDRNDPACTGSDDERPNKPHDYPPSVAATKTLRGNTITISGNTVMMATATTSKPKKGSEARATVLESSPPIACST